MAGESAEKPWRDRAERCWRAALYYRQLIERGERSRYGYPDWPETKAVLIKIAEGFEHEAQGAERAINL